MLNRKLLVLLILVLLISGCGQLQMRNQPGIVNLAKNSDHIPTSTPTPDANATPTPTNTPTATLPPTPTPLPSVWFGDLPRGYLDRLHVPSSFALTDNEEDAEIKISISDINPLTYWVYALVAPFPTLSDGVEETALYNLWKGKESENIFAEYLFIDDDTYRIFKTLWGEANSSTVKVHQSGSLLDEAWNQNNVLAIVPFDKLDTRWKVIDIDGVSPLNKDFDTAAFPLSIPISIESNNNSKNTSLENIDDWSGITNRDETKLTQMALTGVTALVRGTAWTMEIRGIDYPAAEIGEWLLNADITHVNNEVPFYDKCPRPDVNQKSFKFCSDPSYMELFELIGVDVMELAGDHFADFGSEAMYQTLDIYEEAGILTYAGGRTLEEAQQPMFITHNDNRFAFIGCNAKGPPYTTATDNIPGTWYCDYDYLTTQIQQLKAEGYIPIFTYQHFEQYEYEPTPQQIEDAHRMIEAGAVIVSGSQAHQPHGMEFYGDGFIHYGLGNLFFDQYYISAPARTAFLDFHYFYDGEHISTELRTTVFIDMAKPRIMNERERENLLRIVFKASGWQ